MLFCSYHHDNCVYLCCLQRIFWYQNSPEYCMFFPLAEWATVMFCSRYSWFKWLHIWQFISSNLHILHCIVASSPIPFSRNNAATKPNNNNYISLKAERKNQICFLCCYNVSTFVCVPRTRFCSCLFLIFFRYFMGAFWFGWFLNIPVYS